MRSLQGRVSLRMAACGCATLTVSLGCCACRMMARQTKHRTSGIARKYEGVIMYPGRELNPYDLLRSQDFKSCVSTNSTTQAERVPSSWFQVPGAKQKKCERDPHFF